MQRKGCCTIQHVQNLTLGACTDFMWQEKCFHNWQLSLDIDCMQNMRSMHLTMSISIIGGDKTTYQHMKNLDLPTQLNTTPSPSPMWTRIQHISTSTNLDIMICGGAGSWWNGIHVMLTTCTSLIHIGTTADGPISGNTFSTRNTTSL
jgi:hypothetical protein